MCWGVFSLRQPLRCRDDDAGAGGARVGAGVVGRRARRPRPRRRRHLLLGRRPRYDARVRQSAGRWRPDERLHARHPPAPASSSHGQRRVPLRTRPRCWSGSGDGLRHPVGDGAGVDWVHTEETGPDVRLGFRGETGADAGKDVDH